MGKENKKNAGIQVLSVMYVTISFLSFHSESFRVHALYPCEKSPETTLVGEVQAFGNGAQRKIGRLKQPRCLHEQHLVDIIHDRASRELADYSRQVCGGDAKFWGIEGQIVMHGIVFRQQTHETDEEFCRPLAVFTVFYGTFLYIGQVE